MIELTTILSECVRRELKITDETKTSFSEQELAQVSYVSICRNDMDVIKYFKNLSVLELSTFPSLTIEDLKYIGKNIPNIVSLKIKEQNSIYRLDLSDFSNLKELAVIHNDNIVDIVGIDGVNRFTFYDNREYKNIKQLVDYASSHEGAKITMDFIYYIGFKRNSSLDLNDITWVESLGLRNFVVHEYSLEEIDFVMSSLAEVVSRYTYYSDSPMDKFGILYNWMIKNVKFVNEDEVKNDINYKIDNTYHSLTFKEGGRLSYARLFQMLLLYADINAVIVYSYGALDSIGYFNDQKISSLIGTSDYALLRICIDGKNYYTDIAWDTLVNGFKYADALRVFLASKEELTLRHKIVGEGNVVNSYSYHGDDSDEFIQRSLDRIKEVDLKYSDLDRFNDKILNYRVSRETRKTILEKKRQNKSFKYPGEEKVLELSIKADNDFIERFEKEKITAMDKLSSYLKDKHIPKNIDGFEKIREYLDEQKSKCYISNSLYNMLIKI